MRYLLSVLLGAGLLLASAGSQAGDFEIQGGLTDTRQADEAVALWVQSVGLSEPLGQRGRWQTEMVGSVGYLAGRDEPDYGDSVWLVGAGHRLRHVRSDGVASRWFIEGQVLGAIGRTHAISGPIQFGTAVGWDGDRYQVLVRHVSNAGLKGPNRGETMVLLGVSF